MYRLALVDLRGRVLAWKEQKHPVRVDPEEPGGSFSICATSVWPNGEGETTACCASVWPFPARWIRSIPRWLPEVVIPAWQAKPGLEKLEQRYGVPVDMDNDANLGALAEHWWGAGRGVDDFTYLKMSHRHRGRVHSQRGIYRGAAAWPGNSAIYPSTRRANNASAGCEVA